MNGIKRLWTSILMVATLAAPLPAHAASDVLDRGMQERRSGAFAGFNFRINLTPGQAMRPTLRLQSGFRHHLADPTSSLQAGVRQTAMFELGASRRGQPRLAIGGADGRELRRRLGLSTGAAIGVGALVVVGALVIAVAASSPPDIFEEE